MAAAAEQITYYSELSPVLVSVRAAARQQAHKSVEARREQLRNADYDAVPLPVDVLTSAQAVVAAGTEQGPDGPSTAERYAGLRLDCHRLLAEAARKNTYEYFPPLLQTFDSERGEYFSHGFSILDMTEAGLTPIAEPEELERRVNERVEEATYQAIGQLAVLGRALAPETEPKAAARRRIRTISECPDWAIAAHQQQSNGGYGGYVPEIQKFMIRDVVFDTATGDRYEEQVGLPGLHITHDVITEVLEARGVEAATTLTKTELHGLQLVADDELLDFVATLDKAASQRHGIPITMGEPAAELVNYQAIPAAARARQSALETQASRLADDILAMAVANVDRWAATGIVGQYVKDILFSIARTDSTQAAAMFDHRTARGLQEVSFLQQLGEYDQAQARLSQVEASAPAPSYCGAGSCGLEKISASDSKSSTMKEMGLDSSTSLKDTARRCPKCSKKEIVYDLKKKVKGCTGCRSTTAFGKSSQ